MIRPPPRSTLFPSPPLSRSKIPGMRPPRVRIPYGVAWGAALAMEAAARIGGSPPRVSLTAVRMARKHMYFSPAKAVRELGLPQTDVREALRDATGWFRAHGYVSAR